MDPMKNTGDEPRPVPLTIPLDAADMTILMVLGQRPATLGDLSRLTWLDPSQLSLVAGRLVHRWLAEQSGAHYCLTRSGTLLSEKIRAVLDGMGERPEFADGEIERTGKSSPYLSRGVMERVEDLLMEAHRNAVTPSATPNHAAHVDESGTARIVPGIGDLYSMAVTMEKFIDFFESHSLDGVPSDALESLGNLARAELISDISANFSHEWSRYRQILEEAAWIHGVSPFATPEIADAIGERVIHGLKVVLVITPDLAHTILKEPYLEIARNLFRYRNLKFRVSRIPVRVGLTVTDKALSFGLFSRSGQVYDSVYDLICSSPESLEWGERLFSYYLEHSDPLPKYIIKDALSSLLSEDDQEK